MDLFPHISHKLLYDYMDSKKQFFCGDLIAKLTTETLHHRRSSNYCHFWLRTVTAKQEHEERDGFGVAETRLNLISVCLAKDSSVGDVPKKKKENYVCLSGGKCAKHDSVRHVLVVVGRGVDVLWTEGSVITLGYVEGAGGAIHFLKF